jgi:hypothetical protein
MPIKGDKKLEQSLQKLSKGLSKGGTLRVGFLEGSTYPDGTSVPMVAAIQEYGAPSVGIPPRPFFRRMINEKSKEWPKAIAGLLKATDGDVHKTLMLTGEALKGQLQASIVNLVDPPLSPVTVMLRGMRSQNPDLEVNRTVVEQARQRVAQGLTNYGANDKPLIYTSNLLNSVDYEVKD